MKLLLLIIVFTVYTANADVVTTVISLATGDQWSYTLFNDSPPVSDDWLSTFTLYIDAPVTVTGSPANWDFATDGAAFITWFNTDLEFPFPDDIPPGSFLGGFSLVSQNAISGTGVYTVSSWDHTLNGPGPVVGGNVSVPIYDEVVPEPRSGMLLSVSILVVVLRRLWGQHR